MKLLCAWREKEGKPALTAEVEPREDPSPTHGMCPAHREQAEKELEALRRKEEQRHREVDKELEALRDKVDP